MNTTILEYHNSPKVQETTKRSVSMGGRNREEEEGSEHVIDMWEVDRERLGSMEENIAKFDPKLLTKAAGNHSCCIFRVPHSFVEHNRKAYHPRIVSIGPYHRGQSRLCMVQEHKWRYLGSLLSRTQRGLEDLMKAIAPLEPQARKCYSETTSHLKSHEFLEMMLLDGCFIIELFRKVSNWALFEPDDPFRSMRWILPFFRRDFLLLENQIPLFILRDLFQLSKLPEETSFSTLALEFLRPNEATTPQSNMDDAKHLLDLVRSSYIPSQAQEPNEATTTIQSNMNAKHLIDLVRSCFIPCHQPQDKDKPPRTAIIHCISKLRRAGIRITPGKDGDSFLNVTFSNGNIKMPTILVDDVMMYFLPNCVVFEQCYTWRSNHFTSYTTLLDCLINSWRDVEYLCEKKIIQNYLGSEREVADFVNKVGKDVAVSLNSGYLSQLFREVDEYYQNGCHVHLASLKHKYFDTPWSVISVVAALLLLLLTMTQTFLAAYPP